MKNLKFVISMSLLLICGGSLFAQNGNAVISEIKIYDEGDGTGTVEVRISGNLASGVSGADVTISGDRIPGGTFTGRLNGRPDNNSVILECTISLLPAGNNHGPDTVQMSLGGLENSNRGNKDIMAILIRRSN